MVWIFIIGMGAALYYTWLEVVQLVMMAARGECAILIAIMEGGRTDMSAKTRLSN